MQKISMFAVAIAAAALLHWILSPVIRWLAIHWMLASCLLSIAVFILWAVVAWLVRSKIIVFTEDPR